MIDALFLVAVLCGFAAAWCGDRTAWALLASAALTSALGWAEVPFMPWLWFGIDVAVIGAIAWRRQLTASDIAVVALFLPVWCLYAADLPYAGAGVNLIVSVQLMLTFPYRRAWARAKRTKLPPDHRHDLDLPRVAA